MKHNYDDQTIIDAMEAAEVHGDWEAFKNFFDALPEPTSNRIWGGAYSEAITTEIFKLMHLFKDASGVLDWLIATREMLTKGVGIDEVRQITDAWTYGPITADQLMKIANPDSAWQKCTFEEIQKGDRVKRVHISDSGTVETTEGTVGDVDESGNGSAWDLTLRKFLAGSRDMPNVTLYRIPAPVVTPDPVEHLMIVIRKALGMEIEEPLPAVWDGHKYYRIIAQNHVGSFAPDVIQDWTPAAIVPANGRRP